MKTKIPRCILESQVWRHGCVRHQEAARPRTAQGTHLVARQLRITVASSDTTLNQNVTDLRILFVNTAQFRPGIAAGPALAEDLTYSSSMRLWKPGTSRGPWQLRLCELQSATVGLKR